MKVSLEFSAKLAEFCVDYEWSIAWLCDVDYEQNKKSIDVLHSFGKKCLQLYLHDIT